MRFPEDVRARLRELFADELAEHLAAMSQGLSALEAEDGQPPDPAVTREFFRSAHSLKGAAMAAGYPPVESLCHAMETVLSGVRDRRCPTHPNLLGALRHGLDALNTARASVAADELLDLPAIEVARRQIIDAAAASSPEWPAAPPPPSGRVGGAPEPRGVAAAASTLRLPPEQLDGLLDQAGEVLVAARAAGLLCEPVDSALEEFSRERHHWRRQRAGLEEDLRAGRIEAGLAALEEADRAWLAATERLGSIADSVRSGQRALHRAAVAFAEEARRAGMMPFGVVCQGLDAVVRDAARATGRQARLFVMAADVRLDRVVMSALREPLIHLVRNSVDHGIETPEQREAAGKPVVGSVSITADLYGDGIRIVVADDGGGIAENQVRQAATNLGLPSHGELTELLFTPGLSTKTAVTLMSGRGVGLDVVRSRTEALGGSVTVSSVRGRGTEVQLLVPSSAATLRVLIVRVAGHHLAVPLASARRVLRIGEEDHGGGDNGATLTVGGRTVPVVDLATVIPGPEHSTWPSPMAIIVEAGDEWAGLPIDAVLAEEEVVIRPAGPRLAGATLVLGMAVLPDGDPITVLNPSACTRQKRGRPVNPGHGRSDPGRPRRVLVAEDSVTTRALERGILEWAGYEVLTAADGSVAWRLLNERGADLVLADVSMPNMDGLELCRRIRASERFRGLPVVLVTTMAADDHRRRGVEAGADAYLIKNSFDQEELLDSIAKLL
jgi:two-component system, chemotaxis family, sensor kinase CheA